MKEYLQMQDTLGTIGFNQLVSYMYRVTIFIEKQTL